jgi:ABC-type lipoprotein release transport system permease subunit
VTWRAWLERQRALVDFTLASLGRRPGKNLALLVVYALIVAALASTLFFTAALRREAALVLQGAPDVVVQRLVAGRHDPIPAAVVPGLAALRGVSAAAGRRWGYYFDRGSKANLTVQVPPAFWGQEGEVIVGEGVARARAVGPGSEFPMRAAAGGYLHLKVREVIPADTALVSSDLVLLSEADFQRLFGPDPDRFTDVVLTVPNAREIPKVAEKVVKLLPEARAITRAELLRTYESVFDWRSGLVVALLASAVLAFAVVAWDKAAGLSAEERREIGVLKALGWETSDVLLVKLWEGAVVSLLAFGIGVVVAYAHVFLGSAALFAAVLKGWSTLSPDFRLAPDVDPLQLATLFFLTVVPYTVATVVPAWRAATTDPDAVMRS